MTGDTTTDRAVSDLVGYVLMVAVILVGVGLTASIGVDHLERSQLGQNTQSVEQSMELLEGSLDEVQQSHAAVRSSSLPLEHGRLSLNASSQPSAVRVNVSGVGDSPTTYRMGAISYRMDGTTVAYEGGGVFRRPDRGNPVTVAEPTFLCGKDRAIVSVVTLRGPAVNRSYSGGDATLRVRENASYVRFPVNRTGPESLDRSVGVNVTVESDFAGAWADYLTGSDQHWSGATTPAGTVECRPTSGHVIVRQTVVDVSVRR